MVVIINHEREESEKINALLMSNGVDARISNNEPLICSADLILITDCKDLKKLIRKFQLFNLFSLLKMIKKPVIGLGLGAAVMHETIKNLDLPGLAHLNGTSEIIKYLEEPVNVKINDAGSNRFTDEDSFSISKLIKVNPEDSAEMYYNFDGTQYPLLTRKENNYGIYSDISESKNSGFKLLNKIISSIV